MADIYAVDFNKVDYPSNMEDILKKEREQRVNNLVAQSKGEIKKKDAGELIPDEGWNPVVNSCEVIQAAINNYLHEKHYSKERNVIVAPAEVRKITARINHKLSPREAQVNFTSQEVEFLLKVFGSDQPPADAFVYVADYLEKVKAETDKA